DGFHRFSVPTPAAAVERMARYIDPHEVAGTESGEPVTAPIAELDAAEGEIGERLADTPPSASPPPSGRPRPARTPRSRTAAPAGRKGRCHPPPRGARNGARGPRARPDRGARRGRGRDRRASRGPPALSVLTAVSATEASQTTLFATSDALFAMDTPEEGES